MLGPKASRRSGKPDNAVVVTIEYDPGSTRATFSFSGPRLDHGVLEAQAEMVEGVKFASSAHSPGPQELEFYLTDYYSQTRESARAVVMAVLAALGLTAKGEINMQNRSPRAPRPRPPARSRSPLPVWARTQQGKRRGRQ